MLTSWTAMGLITGAWLVTAVGIPDQVAEQKTERCGSNSGRHRGEGGKAADVVRDGPVGVGRAGGDGFGEQEGGDGGMPGVQSVLERGGCGGGAAWRVEEDVL